MGFLLSTSYRVCDYFIEPGIDLQFNNSLRSRDLCIRMQVHVYGRKRNHAKARPGQPSPIAPAHCPLSSTSSIDTPTNIEFCLTVHGVHTRLKSLLIQAAFFCFCPVSLHLGGHRRPAEFLKAWHGSALWYAYCSVCCVLLSHYSAPSAARIVSMFVVRVRFECCLQVCKPLHQPLRRTSNVDDVSTQLACYQLKD